MQTYDAVVIGNFTQDTIVSAAGTRIVDGGGFNYGAHAARALGLKTAAVTRLAREDIRVVEALERIEVDVYPTYTPHSTTLRIEYPTANVDERIISVTKSAGAFAPEQVADLTARLFLLNGSMRGEIGLDFIRAVRAKGGLLAADAQAFVRVAGPGGVLEFAPWPEKREVLPFFDILKTDAVEAESLTGEKDIHTAASMLASWGPREIVLTHRDGLLVLAGRAFYAAPFCPDKLVGRSGRGDTCIASYASMRLSVDPAEATLWAAAVTSMKLEAEGPIRRSRREIERFLAARMWTIHA